VLLDFGAIADGYCSDITRTVVLGTATAEQREVYDVVREANARASGAVRAGMRGMAADAIARDYIDACGYGEAFGHSLGHGIGLEVHEAPRLARTVDAPLAAGMVVTIEPGIYRPGWGGVRIEDDVLLTDTGVEVLTTFPRHLIEIA
jgi:Xaa-Pro aminopeptidase